MRSILPDWEVELARWLKPFLEQLGHKARRRMCPLYVVGLIGPGNSKSFQPMAARLASPAHRRQHRQTAGLAEEAGLLSEGYGRPARHFSSGRISAWCSLAAATAPIPVGSQRLGIFSPRRATVKARTYARRSAETLPTAGPIN